MATKKQQHKQPEKKHEHKIMKVGARGRVFEGFVTKKFATRVVIEFERTVYVQKYKSFYKKKTRIHAHLPQGMDINVGDYIQVRECRPLSKIIHFIVIKKVRSPQHTKEVKA
ncbi:30S ribosomal protein S17 [Candidatus Pacearchaeota archaeon]|nr:30S ribosomal protein S17 [Candidatus Pacearchaeota archaeon]